MRQNPNNNNRRQQRPRHNGGSGGGHSGGGGNHSGNGGGGGGHMGGNRPRSAASLRHQSFDSNCGDLRVRGNAWQVHEKYQALARDAAASGDRVAAENYQQHAEHYFRLIEAIEEATASEQRQRGGPVGSGPTNGGQPQSFSQQPEVPRDYFSPDGNLAQPPAPQPLTQGEQQQAPAEATVQSRTPPPSSFFTPEEVEEHNDDHPLKAVR